MTRAFLFGLMMSAAVMAAPAASALTPKDALGAVAVSPDGKMLVAAGDNRVLYVLDPATLEVKSRVHLGVNPQEAYFSKDGASLGVYDEDGKMHIYAVADWSEKIVVEGGEAMAVMPAADSFAYLSYPTSKEDGSYETPMHVYSLADGSQKLEAMIAGEAKGLAAMPDASGFVALIDRKEDAAEPKKDTPADLQDLAKIEFEQKNDGYTSQFVTLDATGKETGRVTSWYSTYDTMHGVMAGDAAWFAGYSNQNIRIGKDGSFQLFVLAPSYLYGMGIAPDGAKIAAGSLRDGTIYNFADGAAVTYELDEMKYGWPEYLMGFGFAPDGSVYVGTTAYRLAHIGADGKIIDVKPIY